MGDESYFFLETAFFFVAGFAAGAAFGLALVAVFERILRSPFNGVSGHVIGMSKNMIFIFKLIKRIFFAINIEIFDI